jgi:hypothetical protein
VVVCMCVIECMCVCVCVYVCVCTCVCLCTCRVCECVCVCVQVGNMPQWISPFNELKYQSGCVRVILCRFNYKILFGTCNGVDITSALQSSNYWSASSPC